MTLTAMGDAAAVAGGTDHVVEPRLVGQVPTFTIAVRASHGLSLVLVESLEG